MTLRSSISSSGFVVALLISFLSVGAHAQWVAFANETATRLSAPSSLVGADPEEKDYAFADFDQDGDIDLIIVRKQPFTTPGRDQCVLLMNDAGVLTDHTAQYGSYSIVPNSAGMLDLCNNRDVVVADVNGDGWKDIITATTLSGSFPKYISHPRIYINRGNNGSGQWLGFIFDDENRTPTMPDEPRFCGVAAGDVDNDGDMDLYFGDYQQGGNRTVDLDDRLYINNGTGYFTDQSTARMTYQMLESSFGMAVAIADMNGDGYMDIVKDDALNAPQAISVSYNTPANPGYFTQYLDNGQDPYHVKVGDLNNDGRLDYISSNDGLDHFWLNTGNDSLGRAQFVSFNYTFQAGYGDDGFGGNNHIVDLNNDGFKDVIICDVDVDIAGYSRRCHIYRNLGPAGTIAGTTTTQIGLQEQVDASGTICGIPVSMLDATFEVGAFDINGDGWNDLVIGRSQSTEVWMNQPPVGVAISYPAGLPALVFPNAPTSFTVQVLPLNGVNVVTSSGVLHHSLNGGPWQTSPLAYQGANLYTATLPAASNCADVVNFYVTINIGPGGSQTRFDPPTAPGATYSATAAAGTSTILDESFEGTVSGWSVVNTSLTGGAWQIAVPNPTFFLSNAVAPGSDAESGSQFTHCWVTQNGSFGQSTSATDVDGGPTDLISPPFDLAQTDGTITYSRWFFSLNNNTTASSDTLQVAVSGDGVNWTTVESVTAVLGTNGTNQWRVNTFRVGQYITPTSTVYVRWRVADIGNDSLTEAGVDHVICQRYNCAVCQQNLGYGGPGSLNVSVCGGNLSAGTTATLSLTSAIPNDVAYLLVSPSLDLDPVLGGTVVSLNPILVQQVPTTAQGTYTVGGIIGGIGPLSLHVQFVQVDGSLPQFLAFSNIVRIDWP